MPLPTQAVDRIFLRLGSTYGATWDRMWQGQPVAAVKTVWMHELSGFDGERMRCIAWAFDNLPERAPNAIEFRNLCRKAPDLPVALLPEPAADPERVRAELEKMGHVQGLRSPAPINKAWADRILARHKAGENINTYALMSARLALGASHSSLQ